MQRKKNVYLQGNCYYEKISNSTLVIFIFERASFPGFHRKHWHFKFYFIQSWQLFVAIKYKWVVAPRNTPVGDLGYF